MLASLIVSDASRNYYRQHSQNYFDRTVTADSAAILKPVLERVPPPARILDLGCGSGRDLAWLKKQGYTAFGIEAAPELARLARQYSGCPVVAADFTSYPLYRFQADLLLAVGSLVHLPPGPLRACLQHLKKGIQAGREEPKPCGRLYLSFKSGERSPCGIDHGRNFYFWQDKELRAIFSDMGLQIVHSYSQVSALEADDETVWLGYLLTSMHAGKER
jgi:SAM-dependent methyltransferase